MNGKECNYPFVFSRTMRRVALVGACVSAIACAAAQGATVRAWATAVVVDDQIRVADVCDLHGFTPDEYERIRGLVVAPAPKPGGSVYVKIWDVKEALGRAKVNLAAVLVKGASRCAVTRPLVPAPPPVAAPVAPVDPTSPATPGTRTLRQAVIEHFRNEIGREDGTVNVQFGRTAQPVLDLSEPEFSFVVRRRSGRLLGMTTVEVTVRRDGKTVQVVPIVATVSYSHPVLVARRAINAKAMIQTNDVQVIDMTFTQFTQMGLSEVAEALGQRARQFIPAGDPIQAHQLEPVPIVHRGEIVEVHSVAGGVTVVTAAKAMQSGAFGDVIELRTHDGKRRTITGVVTGPRRVQVHMPPQREENGKVYLAGGGE